MMIIIMLILFITIFSLITYNILIKLKNEVKQSKSGIDVYLNQRFDLIPNLVECVKGYSKHEKEIFKEIAEMRKTYIKEPKKMENAEKLNNKMDQLVLIAENYPELKTSEQYLNLQKNLTKIENQLQAARRIYNMAVTRYNNKIETIPFNIIAKIFGFKEKNLFVIEEHKKENIKIKE